MFGIYTSFRRYRKSLGDFCLTSYYKFQRNKKTFVFNKENYNYFIHPYNCTWRNERTIEIPIMKKIIDSNWGKEILEVGNVMSHYMVTSHDVLDKYEVSDRVINEDVISFRRNKKYDLIICVSTLEHVGWDEKRKNYKKVLKAISNLKFHLKKGGRIIFTHPLGYNEFMDGYIKNGKIKLDKFFLMVRISEDNKWKQNEGEKKLESRYNYPFPYANEVIMGVIKK